MRFDLCSHTENSYNEADQQRVWVERLPSDKRDKLIDVIYFFSDDTGLASDSGQCVGWFLCCDSEVASVRELTAGLDRLFAKSGPEQSDEPCLRTSSWAHVVQQARILASTMDNADQMAL